MSIDPSSVVVASATSVQEPSPSNPADAIDMWLIQQSEANPDFDLNQINRHQVSDLISFLQQQNELSPIPGLGKLITQLSNCMNSAAHYHSLPLAQFSADLKLQIAVLQTLSKQLSAQQTTLNEKIESLRATSNETDLLLQGLLSDPARWASDSSIITNQIQELINRSEAFRTEHTSGNHFGLDGFVAELNNALNVYNASMSNVTDPNGVKAKLALSNLREAFHSAKSEYLSAAGVPGNNTELSSAQAGVRSEQLRQVSLLTPTEDTTATPQAVSVEEIETALQDLYLQYQLAVSEGNQDAMAHIQSKMQILEPLKDQLQNGENPLLVGIVMFYQLRFVDLSITKVTQARLRQEAAELQTRNDPNVEEQIADLTSQADALDAKIDALNKQITQVQNQYETVLTTWAQMTNESLSKAF